eukprot:gene27336-biopygen9703
MNSLSCPTTTYFVPRNKAQIRPVVTEGCLWQCFRCHTCHIWQEWTAKPPPVAALLSILTYMAGMTAETLASGPWQG